MNGVLKTNGVEVERVAPAQNNLVEQNGSSANKEKQMEEESTIESTYGGRTTMRKIPNRRVDRKLKEFPELMEVFDRTEAPSLPSAEDVLSLIEDLRQQLRLKKAADVLRVEKLAAIKSMGLTARKQDQEKRKIEKWFRGNLNWWVENLPRTDTLISFLEGGVDGVYCEFETAEELEQMLGRKLTESEQGEWTKKDAEREAEYADCECADEELNSIQAGDSVAD